MRRLVATAAALGMVAVSLLVRSRIDDGDDLLVGDGDEPSELTVVCDPDVAEACKASALHVEREASGETADRIASEDTRNEVWITSSAWLDVAGISVEDATLLARGPIVVAVATNRAEDVRAECSDAAQLACLVGAAVDLDIGMPSIRHATGLAVAGHLATALTQRPDWARNDLDDSAAGTSMSRVQQNGSPFDVLVTRPGTYAAVITDRDRNHPEAEVTPADPPQDIQIVAVGPRRDDVDLDALRAALEAEGWSASEEAVEPLPYYPGALRALLEVLR